jgi:deoxyribodipyrimidine photolyase
MVRHSNVRESLAGRTYPDPIVDHAQARKEALEEFDKLRL